MRDPERYFFTMFGQPSESGRWGLSVEGHHLSLNFVVEKGHVISSTPTAFASNPATLHDEAAGSPLQTGTPVVAQSLPPGTIGVDIAPDGRVLVVMRQDDADSRDFLHVILNWGSTLK